MYLFEKYINYECCCIKIGANVEYSYDYKTLERRLLKSLVKIKKRTVYILDLRRCDGFTKADEMRMVKVIKFLNLKPPKMFLTIGRVKLTNSINKELRELSRKNGTTLLLAENVDHAIEILKSERKHKTILEFLSRNKLDEVTAKNKKVSVVDDFGPNKTIGLVFDSDTSNPYSRSAKIYQSNLKTNLVLTSQTIPETLKEESSDLLLTTLAKNEKGSTVRVAYNCKILKIIKEYKLPNTIIKNALLLEFSPPKREVNLRASYRYNLNSKYRVESMISYGGNKYFSNKHFEVGDISSTGIGLEVPKNGSRRRKSLETSIGDNVEIVIKLIEPAKKNITKNTELYTCIEVVREAEISKNKKHIGFRFSDMQKKHELSINRFINNAQSYELRKKHRTV
ncbi:MAG: PilZ domain-containing protein [Deltaproteobacteria bacterium]|nr:PilZ domain-containing protein [Deltaproteobacteria bacterium]